MENRFFSDKGNLRSQIKLIENDELIQNDDKVAETLNTFFKNAVSTLDINKNSYIVNNESSTILDLVERARSIQVCYSPKTKQEMKNLSNSRQ